MLFVPAIGWKPAAVGGGYSFTMTAADLGADLVGYFQGFGGSIDGEPVEGFVLAAFYYNGADGTAAILFAGDATAELSGKTVWVDGIEYPFDDDWTYDSGITVAGWSSGNGPVFADLGVYPAEIK